MWNFVHYSKLGHVMYALLQMFLEFFNHQLLFTWQYPSVFPFTILLRYFVTEFIIYVVLLGRVVQRLVNVNPGLNVR